MEIFLSFMGRDRFSRKTLSYLVFDYWGFKVLSSAQNKGSRLKINNPPFVEFKLFRLVR